jgi:hypothetical protein
MASLAVHTHTTPPCHVALNKLNCVLCRCVGLRLRGSWGVSWSGMSQHATPAHLQLLRCGFCVIHCLPGGEESLVIRAPQWWTKHRLGHLDAELLDVMRTVFIHGPRIFSHQVDHARHSEVTQPRDMAAPRYRAAAKEHCTVDLCPPVLIPLCHRERQRRKDL